MMRIQQHTSPGGSAVSSSMEIDMAASIWKNRHGSLPSGPLSNISLPAVLMDYYKAMQNDGVHFSASAQRSTRCIGIPPATTPPPYEVICCAKLNRIGDIVPVSMPSLSDDLTDHIRCFLLSSSSSGASTGPPLPVCEVLLVYRERAGTHCMPNSNPEVWGRTSSSDVFYISRCVEDYLRLSNRLYWVLGWQLCFHPEGPPTSSIPWMRMLCPLSLAAALKA